MIKNLGLLFFSVLFILIISEVGLRLLGIGQYNLEDRVLFYTSPSWVTDRHGAVRYAPNVEIRQVAVYGNSIEYDTTKTTNNLGFLDNLLYQESSRRDRAIVLVGDSFTAGSGVNENWVEQLREIPQKQNLTFYNLGISGTGIHHFQKLLLSVEREISFDEIYVIVISHDFFRKFWYPLATDAGVRFCDEQEKPEECKKRRLHPMAFRIEIHESDADLLEKADTIYRSKKASSKTAPAFYQTMSLYNLLCNAYDLIFPEVSPGYQCPHLKIYGKSQYRKDSGPYTEAMDTLHEIAERFGASKIRIFHIPEKGEVYSRKYFIDLESDLEEIGLEYEPLLYECDWEISMYHRHDSHLNRDGYRNLAHCIGGYVD